MRENGSILIPCLDFSNVHARHDWMMDENIWRKSCIIPSSNTSCPPLTDSLILRWGWVWGHTWLNIYARARNSHQVMGAEIEGLASGRMKMEPSVLVAVAPSFTVILLSNLRSMPVITPLVVFLGFPLFCRHFGCFGVLVPKTTICPFQFPKKK